MTRIRIPEFFISIGYFGETSNKKQLSLRVYQTLFFCWLSMQDKHSKQVYHVLQRLKNMTMVLGDISIM